MTTKVYKIGKDTVAFEYPDIYFRFVSLLHNEHPDLLGAMALAQVRMQDFTAIAFLNKILGTAVTREMDMETGYEILFHALKHRKISFISTNAAFAEGRKEQESIQLEDRDKLSPDEIFPLTPTEQKDFS